MSNDSVLYTLFYDDGLEWQTNDATKGELKFYRFTYIRTLNVPIDNLFSNY